MSNMSIIFSVLLTLAMVVVIAPNIIAINRGKVLRNIALWLAIFLALGIVYQNFGPESRAPLFNVNNVSKPIVTDHDSTQKSEDDDKSDDTSTKGGEGFSPPKE